MIDYAKPGQVDNTQPEPAIDRPPGLSFDHGRLNNRRLLPSGPKRNSYGAIAFPLMLDYQVDPVCEKCSRQKGGKKPKSRDISRVRLEDKYQYQQ